MARMAEFDQAWQPPGPSAAAPARSGDIAIAEELDAARRQGSVAAFDLFLARHPSHPLAAVAVAERQRLLTQKTR